MKKLFAYVVVLAMLVLLTGCVSYPPLTTAARNGDIESVKTLIDKGADVNEWYYGTALWAASEKGYTDVAKLLVDRGADVNQMNKGGDSALGFAAQYGNTDIARILIENGADIDKAIVGLEQRAATQETWAIQYSSDHDPHWLQAVARIKGAIKILEKLQKEYFPQVQSIQIVPPPVSAQPAPVIGGEKNTPEYNDATQKLLEAKKLLDANIISKEEFEAIKAELLPLVLKNAETP